MAEMPRATQDNFLDRPYIEKILKSYTNMQMNELRSFQVNTSSREETHGTVLDYVTATYTTTTEPDVVKDIHMIVKARLGNEFMLQAELEYNIFGRETQIYEVILKEANQLLKSIDDNTKFAPEAIYIDSEIIVQDNLKFKGYSIEDVKIGFNYEQCQAIVKKLAKFHAVSMVMYKKNPEMFTNHLPGNFSEHPTPLHDLYYNCVRSTIEFCYTHEVLQKYVSKLENFKATIVPKMINVFSRNQTDRYHVLNHGDIWVNNVMLLKNELGLVDDLLFVDFQEGFFGSPGIDWNFFIFSSWQPEVFKNNFMDLLQLYQEVLSTLLNKFDYEQRIPTVEDIRKEILNKAYHGLATATCLLPVMINEHNNLADPLNFVLNFPKSNLNRRIVFKNQNYATRLEVFLPYFVENGIL